MTNRLGLAAAAAGLSRSNGDFSVVKNWENIGTPLPSGYSYASAFVNKIIHHKESFWAIPNLMRSDGLYENKPIIIKSSDRGGSWSAIDLTTYAGASANILAIEASENRLLALTGQYYQGPYSSTRYSNQRILASDDGGMTWRDLGPAGPDGTPTVVRYVNGRFIVIKDGYLTYARNGRVDTTPSYVGFSLNGEVWSWSALAETTSQYSQGGGIAYGNGVYLLVITKNTYFNNGSLLGLSHDSDPWFYRSTDLVNWTLDKVSYNNALSAVGGMRNASMLGFPAIAGLIFSPRLNSFLIASYSGQVLTSPNAVNWTAKANLNLYDGYYNSLDFNWAGISGQDKQKILDDGKSILIRFGAGLYRTFDGSSPQAIWTDPTADYTHTVAWNKIDTILIGVTYTNPSTYAQSGVIWRGNL